MKNIVLCPNPKRDLQLGLTMKVRETLRRHGVDAAVSPIMGDVPEQFKSECVSLEKALDTAELLVAFGGDGTILHAARAAVGRDVPLIGVNMGTKGFMAELEPENISVLERVIDGGYTVENRMMLEVALIRGGRELYSDFALNDVVIGGIARLINISVYGDGNKISGFSGDGLVVCTPTGSTAYSMSAGGPIVEPWAENIIVTPICAHVLAAKAFVLAPSRVVTVELGSLDGKAAYMSVDGGETFPLESGDTLKIGKSRYVTRLMRMSNKSFYQVVNEKLGER